MKKWTFLALILAVGVIAALAYGATTKVVFEGEHYTSITPSMTQGSSGDASNGAYVQVPLQRPHGYEEGAPTDTGKAVYKIKIPVAGSYRVWARCHWYDGCGNSFFLKIDDKPAVVLGQDGTYQRWHWVKGPTLHLGTGQHTIVLQNREDGSKLDEALLTTDLRYVPVRIEKETAAYVVRQGTGNGQ